jgi:hypothetical protein
VAKRRQLVLLSQWVVPGALRAAAVGHHGGCYQGWALLGTLDPHLLA